LGEDDIFGGMGANSQFPIGLYKGAFLAGFALVFLSILWRLSPKYYYSLSTLSNYKLYKNRNNIKSLN
jgi:hypothetical protein